MNHSTYGLLSSAPSLQASPLGLPDLQQRSPKDQARVASANKLYFLVASLAQELTSLEIVWGIENPRSSLMWWFPALASLLELAGTEDVLFAHCMYGGKRNKVTRVRGWPSLAWRPLARLCDKSHVHVPWGRVEGAFATAEETAYPDELCDAIAQRVVDFLELPAQPPLDLSASRPPRSLEQVGPGRSGSGGRPAQGLPRTKALASVSHSGCCRLHVAS